MAEKIVLEKVEFEIIGKIASGGMGEVFRAVQKGADGFGKRVAIKTLLESYSGNAGFVEKFIDEAKLVANLVHENIVQIYQLAKADNKYFFVLELVNGVSLFDFIDHHLSVKKLPPRELAVFIASRIARGLAYAHGRRDHDGKAMNIVHCDVCPHNILITLEGLPKLTDFGIAKARNMSGNDQVAGKLAFMSPEQARGETLDFRSDIYSLGIVLFCLLSGMPTRKTRVGASDILQQAKDGFVAWERLPVDIEDGLADIVCRMLAAEPGGRYDSTDKLATDLEYHIYKYGYGPTIVSLSDYMRREMPGIYGEDEVSGGGAIIEKTQVMDPAP